MTEKSGELKWEEEGQERILDAFRPNFQIVKMGQKLEFWNETSHTYSLGHLSRMQKIRPLQQWEHT